MAVRFSKSGCAVSVCSERDLVVEIVDGDAGAGGPSPAAGARRIVEAAAVALLVAAGGLHRAAAAAAGAVQHCQFAPESLQDDLGRIALLAAVVGPFARLQRAFHINLRSLAQVFLGDLDEAFVEEHDAVPLRALLALARH